MKKPITDFEEHMKAEVPELMEKTGEHVRQHCCKGAQSEVEKFLSQGHAI